MSEHIISTRNIPKRAIVRNGMTYGNTLRVYKGSPEALVFQVRLESQFVTVTLYPDEAQRLAEALLDVVALFKE